MRRDALLCVVMRPHALLCVVMRCDAEECVVMRMWCGVMLAIALWCILMLLPNAYLLGLHILLWNWGRIMWLNFAVCSYSSCTQMLPVRDSIKMLRDAQWCDEWQMHCNSLNIACDGRILNACKCRMHANLRKMHPLMHVFIMLLEWTWMMFHASWENSMGMHHPQPDVKCNASCNESLHSTMWMNVDGTHAKECTTMHTNVTLWNAYQCVANGGLHFFACVLKWCCRM